MKRVQVPPDGKVLPLDPTTIVFRPADDDPLPPHRSAAANSRSPLPAPQHGRWRTTLACTKCGAAFEGKEHRRKKPYCSNLCRYARDKRGEKHHGAKLTEAQVRAIRADPRRHKFIAADYGLHRVHISRIRSRAIWKHVQ